MGRANRDIQSGWHHVTNRGLDRQPVFRSDEDRVDFGRLLASGHAEFGVAVLAYCLMDNHYHLVLSCPEGGLSLFMQHLGANYTRHANERQGGDGPVFRGRFSSRAIQSEAYLLNAVRYVHRNPLDIRPTVPLASYRWSSHRTYLGRRPSPPWLTLSPVLDWFESAAAFHEFVAADVEDRIVTSVPIAVLVSACEVMIDRHLPPGDRARQGMLRTVLYLLLDRADATTRAALLASLCPRSPSASAQAIRRARRAAQRDPVLDKIVSDVIELVVPAVTLCQTQPERDATGSRLS